MIRKIATGSTGGTVTTTDYIDGFVYVNSTLSYFPMPEGRIVNNGGNLSPEYIITDQQGNARISFNGTGGGAQVVQENSYYGFGMVLSGSAVATPTTPNNNLYNGGSEWQDDFADLPNYMQTFYRNYDAVLGRWIGIDPAAETAESMTGYQYAVNNPIMGNDPLGNKVTDAATWTAQQAQAFIQYNSGGLYGSDPAAYWALYSSGAIPGLNDGGGAGGGGGGGAGSGTSSDPNSSVTLVANNTPVSADLQDMSLPADFNPNVPAVTAYATNPDPIEYMGFNGIWNNWDDFVNSLNQQGPFNYIFGNRSDGQGVTMDIYFTNPGFKYASYQWIQSVSSTPTVLPGLKNPHLDGTYQNGVLANYPFFFEASELPINNKVALLQNATSWFGDTPHGQTSFVAETTLIGIDSQGMLTSLGSFSWGYTMNNGNLSPIAPTFSQTPSGFQQGIINDYNTVKGIVSRMSVH